MLVGVFIRDFKTFKNINYIDLASPPSKNISFFIGDNGVGKSSILEALDVVFNGKEWNLTQGAERDNSSICPVFLIEKSTCTIKSNAINFVSDYFWDFSNKVELKHPSINLFQSQINKLKERCSPKDYYLIGVGSGIDGDVIYTSLMDRKIKDGLRRYKVAHSDLRELKQNIFELYRYAYLPVNISTNEALALQANEIQTLIGKNLSHEIESILKKKPADSDSILAMINANLDGYLHQINEHLEKGGYAYRTPKIGERKIKAEELATFVITRYFSVRPLNKDNKSFDQLSSGEQRIATTEVAKAFLKISSDRKKILILAIDEPEASLSASRCLNQFQNIFDLSFSNNCQVLVATHWYGLLTTSRNADLYHLSKNDDGVIKQNSFDLSVIHEQRRSFPSDVSMKSFFDLTSSILSIIKKEKVNWLLCEGNDDKNYLSKVLNGKVDNLNVLPLGGIGNVVKVFNLLSAILEEDKSELDSIVGKVLCIIDSDINRKDVLNKNVVSKKIKILRWQYDNTKDIASLLLPSIEGVYIKTSVEDCMPCDIFYDAFNKSVPDDFRKTISSKYQSSGNYFSGASSLGFVKIKDKKLTATLDEKLKLEISNYLANSMIKSKISENISNSYFDEHSNPLWVSTIVKFYK